MSYGEPIDARALAARLAAGLRLAALSAEDEDRAIAIAHGAARALGWPVSLWSAADGARPPSHVSGEPGTVPGGLRSPASLVSTAARPSHDPAGVLTQLLAGALASIHAGIFILLDAEPLLTPTSLRILRELGQRDRGPAVIVIGHEITRLRALPEAWCADLSVPDAAELGARTHDLAESLALAAIDAPALVQAGLGLSARDLERALRVGAQAGEDTAGLVARIRHAKVEAFARDGLIELVDPIPACEVGGLAELLAWLRLRAAALEPDARTAGVPWPKGALLVGIPGTGKSLAARACADILGLPLVRLEPGRLLASALGESEANLRLALGRIDRLAPAIVWLDEIDKSLAGGETSASDGGTTARLVAEILHWMQERTAPIFLIATANDPLRLPAELTRRGRLDEVFFLDVPSADERAAIVDVHLRARPLRQLGHEPAIAGTREEFLALAIDAEGLTGAELQSALDEARLRAYADRRPLAPGDLRQAIAETIPLVDRHREQVEALRRWAVGRARSAHRTDTAADSRTGSPLGGDLPAAAASRGASPHSPAPHETHRAPGPSRDDPRAPHPSSVPTSAHAAGDPIVAHAIAHAASDPPVAPAGTTRRRTRPFERNA